MNVCSIATFMMQISDRFFSPPFIGVFPDVVLSSESNNELSDLDLIVYETKIGQHGYSFRPFIAVAFFFFFFFWGGDTRIISIKLLCVSRARFFAYPFELLYELINILIHLRKSGLLFSSFWFIVGRICEFGVHFRIEA